MASSTVNAIFGMAGMIMLTILMLVVTLVFPSGSGGGDEGDNVPSSMASSTVNEMSNSNSKMEELSREIHIAIASFLGVNDVVNYQSCTKQLRKMISLHRLDRPSPISINDSNRPSIIDNSSIIDSNSRSYQGVNGRIHFKTIIGSSFYFSNLIHSVKLTCCYRYQGMGNPPGQITITEKPNQEQQQSANQEQQQSEKDQEQQRKRRSFSLRQVDDNDDESDDDDDESDDDKDIGRIIAESPVAEDHETEFELIFRPKPGFMYYLSYPMLSGEVHQLIISAIKLESFVHSACIPLANTLMDARTSPQSLFHRNMLQYVLDTVVYFDNSSETHCQQQEQEILERPSLSFFQSMGLNLMDEHDVETVRMLLAELDSN